MSLIVAKPADLQLEELKGWVEEVSEKKQVVHGFAKVLSAKEWVLTERDAVENVLVAKLKPNFNSLEVFKEDSPYKIVGQENDRYVLVAKQLHEPSISSREEFEKLLE